MDAKQVLNQAIENSRKASPVIVRSRIGASLDWEHCDDILRLCKNEQVDGIENHYFNPDGAEPVPHYFIFKFRHEQDAAAFFRNLESHPLYEPSLPEGTVGLARFGKIERLV